jgi:FkbM family methyltransferase
MDSHTLLASLSRRLPNLRGKTAVGWKLMERLDRQGQLTGDWRFDLPDGTRLALPRESSISWAVAFHGSYDAATRELLLPHIQPDTLVLDIGASLGLWTVALAGAAAVKGARVWAFEPHPTNHRWLHENIRLNRFASIVTVHETALGDAAGMVTMAAVGSNGGNAVIVEGSEPHGVFVPVATLDSMTLPARVSAIKIDVEGYEVRVLHGAMETIGRDRPIIFGEFNTVLLRERGDDLQTLLAGLRDIGYDVFAVEHLRTRPWLAADVTRLRPLAPGLVAEDLLLRPAD